MQNLLLKGSEKKNKKKLTNEFLLNWKHLKTLPALHNWRKYVGPEKSHDTLACALVFITTTLTSTLIVVKFKNTSFTLTPGQLKKNTGRKSSNDTARELIAVAAQRLKQARISRVRVIFKNSGKSFKTILKTFKRKYIKVKAFLFNYSCVHNGCRQKRYAHKKGGKYRKHRTK